MNLELLCRIWEYVWTSSLSLVTLVSYSKVQRGWHFFSLIEIWHKMHLCLLKCWWFVYHSRRPFFSATTPPTLIVFIPRLIFLPQIGKIWQHTKVNGYFFSVSHMVVLAFFGWFYLKIYFLPSGQLNSSSLPIRNLRDIDEFENKWFPIFTIILLFNQ